MRIEEDREQFLVFIEGHPIEGRLDGRRCGQCGGPWVYYLDFDAFFCPGCNLWLEFDCPDPECAFCRCRPERPLEIRK